MTARKWTTHDGWEVLTGWDRPLQRFFLVIDRDCPECEATGSTEAGDRCPKCKGTGGQMLFSNMRERKYPRGDMRLSDVMSELMRLVTAWPPNLERRLLADQEEDMGNDDMDYGVIGTSIGSTP